MYLYDEIDQRLVDERVAQFRDQTLRFLAGKLSDEEFRALRLRNGLYLQRYAPMLRIAIPYGLLSTRQLRKLAYIARNYDRGYAHFSTRQNLQLNWPKLPQVPDILAELASVQMHAIQTSGNSFRNITTDHFAGVAQDEIVDSFVWCEILRQWSTLHPEFSYLPRKFKVAVNGAKSDRAAVAVHDIGLHAVRDAMGEIGFKVLVGGGLGRTPMIGFVIREFLPWQHLLSYCEAILRVYNRHGRRDNIHKARIKIVVKERGPERFRDEVEAEWAHLKDGPSTLIPEEVARVASCFTRPDYLQRAATDAGLEAALAADRPFASWYKRNVQPHKRPGYAAVTLSLKKTGVPPGDITAEQMEKIADLADHYSFGELRVSHEQNLIFADVQISDLHSLWGELKALGLATPNIGLLTNIICCPGGDFCSLANARSIPVAEAIQQRFDDLDYLHDIGEIDVNISGCMNACGHHHVGHIGILGVDKNGEEWYQIEVGGNQGEVRPGIAASLGKVIGPSFARADLPDVIEKLIKCYLERRDSDAERFIDVVHRAGIEPFKESVYGNADQGTANRRELLAAA
jgi:sulfite reductase (NADPH) hemoprotein beta-component